MLKTVTYKALFVNILQRKQEPEIISDDSSSDSTSTFKNSPDDSKSRKPSLIIVSPVRSKQSSPGGTPKSVQREDFYKMRTVKQTLRFIDEMI